MDDSFKSRVERIFGSLQSSQSSSLQQRPPLWSLTDDKVERRESAAPREEKLCSSSFDEFLEEESKYRGGRLSRKELEDDLDDDDGDDDDENGDSSQSVVRRIDGDGDEWEIKSFFGMDSTLDNEEEEDEYDKVAASRENADERLYMSDISDRGSYLNSQNVLYGALNHTSNKDRRANNLAARIRLKEYDDKAQKLTNQNGCSAEIRESNIQASDSGCQLRSILKRKDNSIDSKPQKCVRFDPACKRDLEKSSEKFEDYTMSTFPIISQDSDDGSLPSEGAGAVSDNILNPSRNTRYSFDSSSEVTEESNTQACMDFLKLVQKSKPQLDDAPRDLPKVTFIPKRKSENVRPGSSASDAQEKEDESKKSLHPTRFPVGIAAAATRDSEVGATEDYESETTAADNTAVIQEGSRSCRVK